MVSVIHPIDRERAQRPIDLDAAAGAGHLLTEGGGHGERAHRVEEHVHLDPRATALGQRGRDVLRRLAVLEDVLGVVDRPAGTADRSNLGGEDLLAVE